MISDILYTYYVARVADHKALQATIATTLLYAVSIYTLYNIIEDPRYFIPAAAGGAIGTFASIEYENWKIKKRGPLEPPEVLSKEILNTDLTTTPTTVAIRLMNK